MSQNEILESAQKPGKSYDEIMAEVTAKIKDMRENRCLNELDANVLVDPWTQQDPFQITGTIPAEEKYPLGQMLAWKNPDLRNKSANIGWMGWIALKYGDPYTGPNGELLSNYMTEIPARLEGTATLDGYVRRGDAILCRIDMRAWMRRQIDREAKYMEIRNQLKKPTLTPDQRVLDGDGFQIETNRKGGSLQTNNEISKGKGHVLRADRNSIKE